MKSRSCACVAAFLVAWLPARSRFTAAEDAEAKKEMVKPVKNSVPVYTSSRVLIGVLDKEAEVEVLLNADQWCKVQYQKDGNRFVGWVLKDDLALTDNPPPKEQEETKPRVLSVEETSEELRKVVRVGINYKASRGEGWHPGKHVAVPRWKEMGNVEMKLDFSGGGAPAKLAVLARFRKDHAIELYVENKIVELKKFQEMAHPDFGAIIRSYVRALEAYNDNRIPDFKRLIESAERFWAVLDSRIEQEPQPIMLVPI